MAAAMESGTCCLWCAPLRSPRPTAWWTDDVDYDDDDDDGAGGVVARWEWRLDDHAYIFPLKATTTSRRHAQPWRRRSRTGRGKALASNLCWPGYHHRHHPPRPYCAG